jgi:hypothetical protein
MNSTFKTAALVLLALVVVIQLVPIHHDNPPATRAIAPPPAVSATLARACFDCHSHQTVWPWYSYVAPVSWLVGHDVHEGRRHMDFSTWGDYTAAEKRKRLASISEMVQERDMPPWYYLPMHAHAKLTDDDVSELAMWADNSTEGED